MMLRRFLFIIFLASLTLLTIVGSWQPAQATSKDTVVYSWGYASLNQHQQVCKQITTHPRQGRPGLETQPVRITSKIVDVHYCQ